jgi:hypothetical protein
MSPTERGGAIQELVQLSAATLLLLVDVQLAKHAHQWITSTGHVQVHSQPKQKNIINCEVIDVDIASVESNHVLFHLVERCMEDSPSNPPYIECPFNGERSLIQTVVMPKQGVDVLKLGNIVQKLLNNVSREAILPIVDNDKENICFLLKKMDRIVVDHFESFNDIGKLIAFESELKGCVYVGEPSNMDAFRNATSEKLSAEDSFANLHPLVRVQVLFQNKHTVRSSIVDGRERSLLLYKHLLGVDRVLNNSKGGVGFCADDRGVEQDGGLSDEENPLTITAEIGVSQDSSNDGLSGLSRPITPQQAMAKMVFVVEILNIYTAANVSARSKLKQESRMREEPLSVGHV